MNFLNNACRQMEVPLNLHRIGGYPKRYEPSGETSRTWFDAWEVVVWVKT